MNRTSALHLELLGPPLVTLGGKELTGFITVKSRALLYYLLMRIGPHSRQSLATLLWPESPESNATKNLRDVLSNLRRLVGGHLDITRETVAIRQEADYFLDVEAFSAFLERYRRGRYDISDLESAVALYRGDFLEGFFVADSPGYENWLTVEREQLRQSQLAALYALAAWHARSSDAKTAMSYASRLLALDSLNEPGQQLKMGLLTLAGQRNAALAHYDAFCAELDEEVGATPLPETTALYERIRTGNFEPETWIEAIARSPLAYFEGTPHLAPSSQERGEPARLRPRVDLSEIPAPADFFGRFEQQQLVLQWLRSDQCRLIIVTGMGGVGKTALVARLIRRLTDARPGVSAMSQHVAVAGRFTAVVWRSLINAPPLQSLIRDILSAVSDQPLPDTWDTVDEPLALLRATIQRQRLLLVLDNYESVLSQGGMGVDYRSDAQAFKRLTQLFTDGEHGSCVIITSRELPGDLARPTQDATHARHLSLSGLNSLTGIDLLRARGLRASDQHLGEIVQHYSGNPLALKLVADTASNVFGGDIAALLDETIIFADIREVLDEQFGRLSPVEEEIINWLAILREPTSSAELWRGLASQPPRRQFIEALRSLHLRSLLERVSPDDEQASATAFSYSLQNVVMEYATSRLIEIICREIDAGEVNALGSYGLVKASSKEFVRDSQRRLLLNPIADWMAGHWTRTGAVGILRRLLGKIQAETSQAAGYAGANILQLLVALGQDLRGYDFSRIAIRDADLTSIVLRDVSFRDTDLSDSIFRNALDVVAAVDFTADGSALIARALDGSVYLWRLGDVQPLQKIASAPGVDLGLALSPDGRTVAIGGPGHFIHLVTIADGQEIGRLGPHMDQILALHFSLDGTRLYSGSLDGSISIWDPVGLRLLQQTESAGAAVYSLASSRDGTTLAAGCYGGIVCLMDANTGVLRQRLTGAGREKIRALAYSLDGGTLAGAGEDKTIQLWHAVTGEPQGELTGHADAVLALAFHPNGTSLASTSADGTVRIWDWVQRELLRVLPGGSNWVTCVAYSPDGKLMASGGYDRTIRLWQHDTGRLLHTLQGSSSSINQIAFSPDGSLLASANLDQPIHLWDAIEGRLVHELKGHRGSIRRMVFSPDSKTLMTSGDGQKIRMWDTGSGELRQVLADGNAYIRTVHVSRDGSLLAAGFGLGHGALSVWEINGGRALFATRDARGGLANSFGLSPDSRFLAYCDGAFALHLVRVSDGTATCVIRSHTAPIETICFAPDGAHLATYDQGGRLCLWRLSDEGEAELCLETRTTGENKDLWNLVFHPNGQEIVFQTADSSLALLDLGSGQIRWSVAMPLHSEGSLAFTADGSAIVSLGGDGILRVWDAGTGCCVRTINDETSPVWQMAVHADSNRVAGGGNEGDIRIWDIRTGEPLLLLSAPGPYEGMVITNAAGLSSAQAAVLQALGAVAG